MSLWEYLDVLWLRLRLWWRRPTKRQMRCEIEKFLKDYLQEKKAHGLRPDD